MKNKLATWIATWFGCGYSPFAPGTAGSLGGLAPAWILCVWAGWPPWSLAILTAALTIPGIWASGVVARNVGRKDPQIVVVDEVLGQWLTLAGAPVLDWRTAVIGFILFRLLDIWKPAPARQFENLPGGTGIVADDLMAGVYGALLLAAISRFLP